MSTIEMTSNDTLPQFVGEVQNDDGTPADLTGVTITLHLNYPTPLVKTATLVGDGKFHFNWVHGDLKPGRWEAEIQFDSTAGIQTFHKTEDETKMMFRIRKEIA